MPVDHETHIERMLNLLPSTEANRSGFYHGVGAVEKQGELEERPESLLEEVAVRYETWLTSDEPRHETMEAPDKQPAMLLGMFAEVSAMREARASEDLLEAELEHSSYEGSR